MKNLKYLIIAVILCSMFIGSIGLVNACDCEQCDCEGDEITFDDGRLSVGDEIGDTYADLGVTFSDGATIVDTKWWGTDLGFWNPDSDVTTISFSPTVTSVSIQFKDSFVGNMDAILVNGEVLTDTETNRWWFTDKTLMIESIDVPIASIGLSSSCSCVNCIKFDNLCYTQTEIPEFPTIAFPVVAVLGLALFFQRRKE